MLSQTVIERAAAIMRGLYPIKVEVKGASIPVPTLTVIAIILTEPSLAGGTLNSVIREPKFYQPPIPATKMMWHTYITIWLMSGKKMKKK